MSRLELVGGCMHGIASGFFGHGSDINTQHGALSLWALHILGVDGIGARTCRIFKAISLPRLLLNFPLCNGATG